MVDCVFFLLVVVGVGPCCMICYQRKQLMNLTDGEYRCCGGMMKCLSMDKPKPEACLYCEGCCCPFLGNIGNRYMLQTNRRLRVQFFFNLLVSAQQYMSSQSRCLVSLSLSFLYFCWLIKSLFSGDLIPFDVYFWLKKKVRSMWWNAHLLCSTYGFHCQLCGSYMRLGTASRDTGTSSGLCRLLRKLHLL